MKLTPEQAAAHAKCHRLTVIRWIKRGWLPASRSANGRWLISLDDLKALKEAFSK